MNEFVGKPERANAYRQSARKEVAKRANKRRYVFVSVKTFTYTNYSMKSIFVECISTNCGGNASQSSDSPGQYGYEYNGFMVCLKMHHILYVSHSFRSSFIFQGLIVGSVFYDMPETTGAFFSRGGDLF